MMNGLLLFLNIGTSEMMLILFVALFLFGGKKLPELARGLGRGIREFKDASESIKRDISDQINNLEEEIDEVKADIKSLGEDIKEEKELSSKDDHINEDPNLAEVPTEEAVSEQHHHNYDYNYPEESDVSPSVESVETDASHKDEN